MSLKIYFCLLRHRWHFSHLIFVKSPKSAQFFFVADLWLLSVFFLVFNTLEDSKHQQVLPGNSIGHEIEWFTYVKFSYCQNSAIVVIVEALGKSAKTLTESFPEYCFSFPKQSFCTMGKRKAYRKCFTRPPKFCKPWQVYVSLHYGGYDKPLCSLSFSCHFSSCLRQKMLLHVTVKAILTMRVR